MGKRAFWREAVDDIEKGKSADAVVKRLNKHYKTPCARRTYISRVRNSLSQKRQSEAKKLRSAKEDIVACKSHQRKASQDKLKKAVRFDNVALLDFATETLRDAENADIGALALALLTVTGRRTSEIMSSAKFAAVPKKARQAEFTGQMKKRGNAPSKYRVPLLCEQQLVEEALGWLRKKQPKDITKWSPSRVSRRYQSSLRAYSKTHSPCDSLRKVHDLRGCYAVMAHHLYDMGDAAELYAVSRILGQSDANQAWVYSAYKMTQPKKFKKGSFGKFRID